MNANSDQKKILFPFTPIPNFVFDLEILENKDFFRFLVYAFSKTAYEKKSVVFHGQRIDLDPMEFIFGRNHWAVLLEVSESQVRRFIRQLVVQDLAIKQSSKSTSKLSVYKWVSSNFPGFCSQQKYQPLADSWPSTQPQSKNKKKNKKAAADENSIPNETAAELAAASSQQVENLSCTISQQEQEAVINLFGERAKSGQITNPEGWIRECIKYGWHKEKRAEISDEKKPNGEFEANRMLAKQLVQKLEGTLGVRVWLRMDFLEIGRSEEVLWQIFFCEAAKTFRKKLQVALKRLNLTEELLEDCDL